MDVPALRQQWYDSKAADEARSALIDKLINQIESLTTERDKALSTLQYNVDFVNYVQKEKADMAAKLEALQKSIDRDQFILVLVDGDNTLFTNDYMRRGAAGGHDAARDLRTRIAAYLESIDKLQPHWKIMIQVFSNLAGLCKTYRENKIVDKNTFWQFILGFNKEHPLSAYVDAGDDKEAADRKIQYTMDMFHGNVHCKHIMLAGSGDNSYTGFLRQYTLTNEVCQDITLIEALPFAKDLQSIAPKFLTAKFEPIFRDSKIANRKDSSKDERMITPPETPSLSYASTVSRGKPRQSSVDITADLETSRDPFSTPPSSTSSEVTITNKIPRNKNGQRVDTPLHPDLRLVQQLKFRKLCNRHFLSSCPFPVCTHDHDGKLTSDELESLRFVARLSPCQFSVWCSDPTCVSGHRCVQDPKCTRGSNCRFAKEMHNIDMRIVELVTV